MGAGASTARETAAQQGLDTFVANLEGEQLSQWIAGKDIKDNEMAMAEITKLRTLMHKLLVDPSAKAKKPKEPVARAAVMDRQAPIDIANYTPKKVPKSAEVRAMLMTIMEENILFRGCKKEEKADLVDAFEPIEYTSGAFIIEQGKSGDDFFAVEAGTAKAYLATADDSEIHVSTFTAGKSFGELALMYNTPRAASIKAETTVKLWRIDRLTFRTTIQFYQKQRQEKYIGFLSEVMLENKKMGDVLGKDQLARLAGALDVEYFEEGDMIIRQGETGDFFYILAEGEVEIIKVEEGADKAAITHKELKRPSMIKAKEINRHKIGPGAYFGEKALIAEDKRQASCLASAPCRCLCLGREDFVAMLGNVAELGAPVTAAAPAAEEPGAEEEKVQEKIDIADLTVLRTLGCGAFGRVKLVEHKTTGQTYALKCQAKKAIIDNGLQEHILNERRILKALDHKFILKIFDADQDDRYIYFVLELLLGGELFTHLRKKKRFLEREAKFYAAQVLLAFQHIHKKKIAYRDLKPENLVLTDTGYIKVVDFGLAKVVDGKTWTLCGTPDYLAPEIILNEGHDKAVDYWAFGVLIYEMVAGEPPFYANDPMEVYEKILSAKMQIPGHFSKNLADIIRKLLKIYQSKRLGNGKGGCNSIIKHKWFYGFDWEMLLEKKFPEDKIPIVPKVKNSKDASAFEFDDSAGDPEAEPCPEWMPAFK